MQNRFLAGIMIRYAVRAAILAWVVTVGLLILPVNFWAMFIIIPGVYAILLWQGMREDCLLDEKFEEFPYTEYFSVTGEKGKFRICKRQFRSYSEMIEKILTKPELICLERNAISFQEGETTVARAEFSSGCEMLRFYQDFMKNISYPYMAMRGLIRYW